MNTNSLIIDLRSQLPWHRRYVSTTTTAMLWGCWFLLWRPMVVLYTLIVYQKHYAFHKLFNAFWLGLQMDMIILITCAAILSLWCKLIPARTVKHIKQKSMSDYSRYFELPEQQIVQGRQQKISVVHHNEYGQIVRVE
ncbi:MAG: poly-beta-1,6-N-acetyl-D-glucosamine biosynthesis protein PgaD [Acinetobacter sp.]